MRVSTRRLTEGPIERIQKVSEELVRINEKIASGKVINRPSDDPVAVVNSMTLKTGLSQIEQYQRNIRYGVSWLDLRESVLTEVKELTSRAQELAIQMASDNQSPETRADAATEMGHLLDQAIALGNTRLGENYIFAGYKTRTTPFSKTVLGGVETATYNGDGYDIQIQIGRDEALVIGRNGQTTLMDSNVFTTLGSLKQALADNDVEAIRQQIGQLEGVNNYLDNEIADTGAKSNRMDVKNSIWGDMLLDLKKQLSNAQDADVAGLVTQSQEKQVAYQAALLVSARLSQLSILNYIG
jgi:flagellar hook-associated protein 3 FlgL